jgi:hypothetical protein
LETWQPKPTNIPIESVGKRGQKFSKVMVTC